MEARNAMSENLTLAHFAKAPHSRHFYATCTKKSPPKGALSDVDLAHDVRSAAADGAGAHAQLHADGDNGFPAPGQAQHLALVIRQAVGGIRRVDARLMDAVKTHGYRFSFIPYLAMYHFFAASCPFWWAFFSNSTCSSFDKIFHFAEFFAR